MSGEFIFDPRIGQLERARDQTILAAEKLYQQQVATGTAPATAQATKAATVAAALTAHTAAVAKATLPPNHGKGK